MQARVTLIPVLLLAAACGKGSEGAAPAASTDPAGVVLRLGGEVTASRPDQERRPLRAGDQVFSDEFITTAAEASVAIQLHHNGAVWELAASQSRRVDQSAAWKAPKGSSTGSALAKVEAEHTAAAGRQAEPSAQDRVPESPESAVREEPMDEEASAAAAPPPPPPGKKARARTKSRGASKSGGAAPPAASAPAPEPTADLFVEEDSLGAIGEGGLGGAIGSGSPGTGGGGLAGAPTRRPPEVAGKVTVGKPQVDGPIPVAEATRSVRRYSASFRRCYRRALQRDPKVSGQVRARLVVTPEGKVAKADLENRTGASDLAGCLSGQMRRLRFPPQKAGSTVTVVLIFRP